MILPPIYTTDILYADAETKRKQIEIGASAGLEGMPAALGLPHDTLPHIFKLRNGEKVQPICAAVPRRRVLAPRDVCEHFSDRRRQPHGLLQAEARPSNLAQEQISAPRSGFQLPRAHWSCRERGHAWL